jgi:hypothetical protein
MEQSLPTSATAPTSRWRIWHTVGLVVLLVGIVLILFLLPFPLRIWSWVITLALLAGITLLVSHGITGYWRGALIDSRNRLSLSRLQTSLWSLLIFSSFLSATLFNLRGGQADPLLLTIPAGLWVLMGISATSLVGTPLIHNVKQNRDPNTNETNATLAQLAKQRVNVENLSTNGVLLVNKGPASARWSDLFRGEEIGNASQIDLGKVQLFYFTIILVLIFTVTMGFIFASQTKIIGGFPDINDGTLTFLGISHAAYLTNKAVPHSTSPALQP